jgi:hypothetical protein
MIMVFYCTHFLYIVGAEKQDSKGKASEVNKEQQQVPPGVGGATVGGAIAAAGAGGIKRPGQFGGDKQPDPKRKRT